MATPSLWVKSELSPSIRPSTRIFPITRYATSRRWPLSRVPRWSCSATPAVASTALKPGRPLILLVQSILWAGTAPHILGHQTKSGKVTALAVAAPQRSPFLPNVPTTAELGQPKMVMDLWIGVVACKGTPDTIIQRLHAAFENAMSDPAVWKKFSEFGYNRLSMTPEEFNRFIKAEIDKYCPIVVDSGAVVD